MNLREIFSLVTLSCLPVIMISNTAPAQADLVDFNFSGFYQAPTDSSNTTVSSPIYGNIVFDNSSTPKSQAGYVEYDDAIKSYNVNIGTYDGPQVYFGTAPFDCKYSNGKRDCRQGFPYDTLNQIEVANKDAPIFRILGTPETLGFDILDQSNSITLRFGYSQAVINSNSLKAISFKNAVTSDSSIYIPDPRSSINPAGLRTFDNSGTVFTTSATSFPPGSIGSGNTSGRFDGINVVKGAPPLDFISGTGTNQVTFGSNDFSSFPNSLSFNGTNFTTVPNAKFVLGTLTYKNGTVDVNSNSEDGIFTSDITVTSNSSDTSPYDFNKSFNEQVNLDATPNVGDIYQNADSIYFPNHPEFGSFRVFEGETGTVQLLGTFDGLELAGFGNVVSGPDTGFVYPTTGAIVPEPSEVVGTLTIGALVSGTLLRSFKRRMA
ncbi:MAG: choice-of-anchor K domain-containing protein [Chroococcidiopsidaceae cyanobacterium CP_BM_RX_35]|nr:choice-of-anchor K domain-containing protein [Chroococcidiopsidaceae cyanobacterium CP_BM_RX_35]